MQRLTRPLPLGYWRSGGEEGAGPGGTGMGQLLLSHQAPHGPGNHHAQHAGSGPEPEFAISLGVEVAIQGDRWGGGVLWEQCSGV